MKRDYEDLVVSYPNWPRAGITFRDISPLLADGAALHSLMEDLVLVARVETWDFTHVVGVDARGFILATPIAVQLGKGLVMCRKKGKLPGPVHRQGMQMEYDRVTMEMQDGTAPIRALVVDDVLATGETAWAACRLVQRCGGEVAGVLVGIELRGELHGRALLEGYDWPVRSLMQFGKDTALPML